MSIENRNVPTNLGKGVLFCSLGNKRSSQPDFHLFNPSIAHLNEYTLATQAARVSHLFQNQAIKDRPTAINMPMSASKSTRVSPKEASFRRWCQPSEVSGSPPNAEPHAFRKPYMRWAICWMGVPSSCDLVTIGIITSNNHFRYTIISVGANDNHMRWILFSWKGKHKMCSFS